MEVKLHQKQTFNLTLNLEILEVKHLKLALHCAKSVLIRSFSGLHFPVFGLNTERYEVFLLIQPECRKILTRKTLNTDFLRNFSYSLFLEIFKKLVKIPWPCF